MESHESDRLDQAAGTFSTFGGTEGVGIRYGYESIRPWLCGNTCLELGPADGQLTSLLREDFRHVVSVDGSEVFVQTLQETFGFDEHHAIVASLFEEYAPDEQFDTIVAARIMEHVDSPIEIFRRMRNWVSGRGRLIVQVPNANSFHRLLGVKMGQLETQHSLNERDIAVGHRRVYDWQMLETDLSQGGWTIEAKSGCFFKPFSNAQLDEMATPALYEGLYQLGKDFPDYGAVISACCSPTR